MTTQLASRRSAGDKKDKRRNKAVAFALAGVVATAGIAGVVVTSSAFFTDVKEIGTTTPNVVSLQGVDIDAFSVGESTTLATFALDGLSPVDSSNATAYGAQPTKVIDVRNISKSAFKYKVEVTGISVTDKAGAALPSVESSSALTAATAMGVIKVSMERGAKGTTPSTYTPSAAKTLLILNGDSANSVAASPEMLPDSTAAAQLTAVDNSATTDEAVVGVRFWIDQSLISSWTADRQNLLQNLKVTYKLKFSAVQL